ncbi:MAG: pyrophosphatase [Nanoarchaeota archaeon]
MDENSFVEDIKKFNEIYKIESNESPVLPSLKRIINFKDILEEEVREIDKIIEKYRELAEPYISDLGENPSWEEINKFVPEEVKIEILTELADWLGDIKVYAASEAKRYGIPIYDVLNIIMQSNFSKLGEGEKPIYDERGKIMKGPGYWKPEPKIKELLKEGLSYNERTK